MKEPTKKTRDTISSNLSHYIRLAGINNKDLSRDLGVEESTVGKWLQQLLMNSKKQEK